MLLPPWSAPGQIGELDLHRRAKVVAEVRFDLVAASLEYVQPLDVHSRQSLDVLPCLAPSCHSAHDLFSRESCRRKRTPPSCGSPRSPRPAPGMLEPWSRVFTPPQLFCTTPFNGVSPLQFTPPTRSNRRRRRPPGTSWPRRPAPGRLPPASNPSSGPSSSDRWRARTYRGTAPRQEHLSFLAVLQRQPRPGSHVQKVAARKRRRVHRQRIDLLAGAAPEILPVGQHFQHRAEQVVGVANPDEVLAVELSLQRRGPFVGLVQQLGRLSLPALAPAG